MSFTKPSSLCVDNSGSLTALFAALSLAATAKAQTVYVDDSAPSGGDGQRWNTPFNDLQDALDYTSKYGERWGTEIKLGQGVYKAGRGSLDRNSSFHISRFSTGSALSVSIQGGYAGYGAANPNLQSAAFVTVVTADLRGDDTLHFGHREDNARRIFDVKGLQYFGLNNVTIAGANATDAADSAVISVDSAGTLSNSELRLSKFSLVDHEVGPGGALIKASGRNCSLSEGSVRGNRANVLEFSGTPLYEYDSPYIYGCVFENNSGGILKSNVGVGFQHCWMLSNGAWPGSGSAIISSRGTLQDCFISGNKSTGTWWVSSGLCYAIDSTFVANDCGGDVSLLNAGGGLYIHNSILWGNRIGAHGMLGIGDAKYLFAEFSDIERGTAAFDGRHGALAWGRGNIDADPRFDNLSGADGDLSTWEDNIVQVSPASPCIDAGNPQSYNTSDILGNQRAIDGNGDGVILPDIGAIEYVPPRCGADIDENGVVDAEDLWTFWALFDGAYEGYNNHAPDFNHDGFVTGDDWDAFIDAYVAGC